jgi:putative transposase
MPNQLHLLWSSVSKFHEEENELTLLRFTGHAFIKHLQIEHPRMLNQYLFTQKDLQFHFWERCSRTIEVMSRRIAEQKLAYIHFNPISGRWRLASNPEKYFYSSAFYYILN